MKKTVVFISALFFLASVTFAQTPQTQTQDKTKSENKTECPMKKDNKCTMDKKDPKSCPHATGTAKPADNTKSKDTKKTETAPEKK